MSEDMIQLLQWWSKHSTVCLLLISNFFSSSSLSLDSNASWNMMHKNGWISFKSELPLRYPTQTKRKKKSTTICRMCAAGGFCYFSFCRAQMHKMRGRETERQKNNICIEIQSLFHSHIFGITLYSASLLLLEFIGRWQRTSRLSMHRKRYKLAQIYSNFFSPFCIFPDLTKQTKAWRTTWIQRLKHPWSTRQMFHCQSSSRLSCRRTSWSRRMIRVELKTMMTQANRQNQDCVSCFRFFSFLSHSQRCWACSSSIWIHRVSKFFCFFASITMRWVE